MICTMFQNIFRLRRRRRREVEAAECSRSDEVNREPTRMASSATIREREVEAAECSRSDEVNREPTRLASSSSSSATIREREVEAAECSRSDEVNREPTRMASSSSYDVFLSFRGEDTRKGFISHLRVALHKKQILTFDDENMNRGAGISPSILTAIEKSTVSLIIFSENYADSKWCLKELAKIIQCKHLNGQLVIPVFYEVDPSHVKKQIGNFGVAFDKLKERLREGEMDLNEVKSHLEEAANIAGWNSHHFRLESELITSIVKDIVVALEVPKRQSASLTKRPVGDAFKRNGEKTRSSIVKDIVVALEVPKRQSASLTKRPVGDAFKRNGEKIWSWLMDDQVLRVGIYGMGGVGKTTLMRHIQTRRKGQSSFEVYWVTVSQDFSIWKLQNLIAKKIVLDFSDDEDEVDRAGKLTQSLKEKGKCVLILDDLWNYFDVDEVGIPVGVNTCKLVLTTRLLDVCRRMDCSESNTIQVQALSEEEAWILFTQELGNYRTEVEELAKAVCRECAGLPLGIRVMARSMKGICSVHTWRNTLKELKESKVSKGHEMREEVFSVLKFSYLRLNDPALQECLSYCALFPEDYKIERNELIEYMIVEGIIDEGTSRQAEFDKGHTMLDTLQNACLLEGDTRYVSMHDLIRDMLILELREGSKTLVEAGAQLKELPGVEKWTENLVRVSLMHNDIEVIPSGHTPRSPNLSTLLLHGNDGLKMIADSFLDQFQGLKVLDLSGCQWIVELPRSISDLVNLTALLLRECVILPYVPSLAKLEKLKKLDLRDCKGLKQMPEGVRFLLNLKYLDLSRNGIKEIESGIIPMLSRLQVLKLCNENGRSKFSIRGSEVGELRMLETLYCRFSNVREFGEYMKSRERSQQSPSDYFIFISGSMFSQLPTISTKLGSRKFMSVSGDNFIYPSALPTDIEALNIKHCHSTLYKRLFPPSLQEICVHDCGAIEEIFAMNEGESGERGFPFSNYSTSTHSFSNHSLLNLKLIEISECHKLKKLFPPSLLPNLHNLQKISVRCCSVMEEIFSTDREEEDGQEWMRFPFSNYSTSTHSLSNRSLLNLKKIDIRKCRELKKLFPPSLLPNLHNLQKISVDGCHGMEEIFSTYQEEEDGQELLFDAPDITGLHLPNLIALELSNLQELRSIYNGAIICHSLKQIHLVDCPMLKRITLPLAQPSLRRIEVSSKEWWDSVQWGFANDKNYLESLCDFKEFDQCLIDGS